MVNLGKKQKQRLISLISGILLICFPGTLVGRDLFGALPEGVDAGAFQEYLDQADLARDREEWRTMVHFGVEVVVAEWERDYFLLSETGGDATPEEVRLGLEAIAEERYVRFVVAGFFRKEAAPDMSVLGGPVRAANRAYLFESDPDTGEVLFDELGNPELKKAKGAEGDRERYREMMDTAIDEALGAYVAGTEALYGDILTLLPEEPETLVREYYSRTLSGYRLGYRAELTTLAILEERRFYARRRTDQYSLRVRSEAESASAVAGRLIGNAREELAEGLRMIEEGLDTAAEDEAIHGGSIAAETWREDFRRVFDQGMKRWEEAEEALLYERMSWEQRGLSAFEEGERAWQEAFEGIVTAREEWQNELRSIINSGQAAWETKETELAGAIGKAREELEAGIASRKRSMSEQINNLVTVYTKAMGMVGTARESLEYWTDPDNDGMMFIDGSGTERTYRDFWESVEETYLDYMRESGEKLVACYGIVLADDPGGLEGNRGISGYSGGYGIDELLGRIGEGEWDSYALDGYQLERIKAGMVKEYWDRQYDVARAVYEYSRDLSSGRPREDETRLEYEEAYQEFSGALEEYERALDLLGTAAADMRERQEDLSGLTEEIALAEQRMRETEEACNRLQLLLEAEDGSFFKSRITSYYKELMEKSGLSEGRDVVEEAAFAYFGAARDYGIELFYEDAAALVRDLFHGTPGEGGIDSLSMLESRKNASEEWEFDPAGEWEASLEAMGVGPGNGMYGVLSGEWERYRDIDGLSITGEEKNAYRYVAEARIRSWMEQVYRINVQAHADRILRISLLTAPSMERWVERNGFSPGELEMAGRDVATLDQVLYLGETYQGRYLEQKAAADRALLDEALDVVTSIERGDTGVTELWSSGEPPAAVRVMLTDRLVQRGKSLEEVRAELEAWRVVVERVAEFFGEADPEERYFVKARTVEFRELIGSSSLTKEYVRGVAGPWTAGVPDDLAGDDGTGGLMTAHIGVEEMRGLHEERMRRSLAAGVCRDYLGKAPALKAAYTETALETLDGTLGRFHIGRVEGGTVVLTGDYEALWTLWKNDWERPEWEGREAYLAELTASLASAGGVLPGYAAAELSGYTQTLLRYAALRSLREGVPFSSGYLPGEGEVVSQAERLFSEKLERLGRITRVLNDTGPAESGDTALFRLLDVYREMEEPVTWTQEGYPPLEKGDVRERVGSHIGVSAALWLFGEEGIPDGMDEAAAVGKVEEYLAGIGAGEVDEEVILEAAAAMLYHMGMGRAAAGGIAPAEMSASELRLARRILWWAWIPGAAAYDPGETVYKLQALKAIAEDFEPVWPGNGIGTGEKRGFLADRYTGGDLDLLDECLAGTGTGTFLPELFAAAALLDSLDGVTGDGIGQALDDAAKTILPPEFLDFTGRETQLGAGLVSRIVGYTLAEKTEETDGYDGEAGLTGVQWLFDRLDTGVTLTSEGAGDFTSGAGPLAWMAAAATMDEREFVLQNVLEEAWDTDIEAYLLPGDGEAGERLAGYAGRLSALAMYAPEYEDTPLSYCIDRMGAGSVGALALGYAVLQGMADPRTGGRYIAGGNETFNYLSGLAETEGRVSLALSEILATGMDQALAAVRDGITRASFRRSVEVSYRTIADRSAGDTRSWRSYIGAGFQDQDALPGTMTAVRWSTPDEQDPEKADDRTFTYVHDGTAGAGGFYGNELLDIAVELHSAGMRFTEAAAEFAAESGDHPVKAAFLGDFGFFYGGTSPVPEELGMWDDRSGELSMNAAYDAYTRKTISIRSLTGALQETGGLLSRLVSSASRQELIDDLRAAGEALEERQSAYNGLLEDFGVSVTAFRASETAYAVQFAETEEAELVYRRDGHTLDKAEAMYRYASSPYTGEVMAGEEGADASDPSARLAYVWKKKVLADAAYNGLNTLMNGEEPEDFALRDSAYRDAYEQFVDNGKKKVWLAKISALMQGEIGKQVKRVQEARREMEENLDTIVSGGRMFGIENRDLPGEDDADVWDFVTGVTLTVPGVPGAFTEAPGGLGSVNGRVMHYLNDGTDSEGAGTRQFVKAGVRDNYFYFGGSPADLVENYGFTMGKAQAEYEAYEAAAGEGRSFQKDRNEWARTLNRYIESRGLTGEALYDFFQKLSLAAVRKDSLLAAETGVCMTDGFTTALAVGGAFTGNWINDGYNSETEKYVAEEKLEEITDRDLSGEFASALDSAYEQMTQAGSEEKEIFDFFYLARAGNALQDFVDPVKKEAAVEAMVYDWIMSRVEEENNRAIAEVQSSIDGLESAILTVGIIATILSAIPFIGVIMASPFYAMMVALGVASAVETAKLNKYGDILEYFRNTQGGEHTNEYISHLGFYAGRLGAHEENAVRLAEEEAVLAGLRGGTGAGKPVSGAGLKAAVLTGLSLKGISLGAFLHLTPEDMEGRSESEVLDELIATYDARVGEEHRTGVVDFLGSMRGLAESGREEGLEDLQAAYTRLSGAQGVREQEYREAEAGYRAYLNAAVFDEERGVLLPGGGYDGEDEGGLLERLDGAAREAYFDPAMVKRTHLSRLAETRMRFAGYAGTEPESAEVITVELTGLGQEILNLQNERYRKYREAKETEWAMMWENLEARKQEWNDTIRIISIRGGREWSKSVTRYERKRQEWVNGFTERFERKRGEWELKYADFISRKSGWVKDVAEEATAASNERLGFLERDAEMQIRESVGVIVEEMNAGAGEPGDTVRELTGGALSTLLRNARFAGTSVRRVDTAASGRMRADALGKANIMDLVKRVQEEEREEIEEQILFVTAMKAMEAIREAEEGIGEQIARANEGMEKSMDGMLKGSGYTKGGSGSGAVYGKELLVDSTVIGGNDYEHQEIEGYGYYVKPADVRIDPGYELEAESFEGKNARVMEMMIGKGMDAVERVMRTIFGEGEEITEVIEGRNIREKEGKKKAETEEYTEYVEVTYGDGQFNAHVGYAPELIDSSYIDPVEAVNAERMSYNVKHEGKGELGRILLEYMRQRMLENRGVQEYAKPTYERRLWDDDESTVVKAPTIRGVVDMGVAVLATVIAGPAGAAILNLVDDAAFAFADIGYGRDAGEMMLDLGKKAVTGFATGVVGTGSSVLGEGIKAFGNAGGRVLSRVGLSVSTMAVNNVIRGAVNAVTFDYQEDGTRTLGWDREVFTRSVAGEGAVAGYVGAAAGGLVSGSMREGIRGTISRDYGYAASLGGLVESGIRAGIDYGITGETAFSLAGIRGKGGRTGLFELNIRRGQGVTGQFGMGGYDVGIGTVVSAVKGFKVFGRNRELAKAGITGRKAVGIRMLASGGMEGKELYESLIAGNTELLLDQDIKGMALTVDENGKKTIKVSSLEGRGSDLALGVVLSHEAFRDGVVTDDNVVETVDAVLGHSMIAEQAAAIYGGHYLTEGMRTDIGKLNELIRSGDMNAYAGYVGSAYDSTADYWKVLSDGNVIFDGSKNTYDENGKLLNEYKGTGGFTDSLKDGLGISYAEADKMMKDAGWTYGNGTFTTDGGATNVLNNTDFTLNTSANFKARYDVQMNVLDKVWSDHDGDMVSAISSSLNEIDLARASGTLTDDIVQKYQVLTGLEDFANAWNDSMYGSDEKPGNWDMARAADYENRNVEGEFAKIFDDFVAGRIDNSNYMYQAVNSTIFPLGGRNRIVTEASYGDSQFEIDNDLTGKPHGRRRGGLGIDLGTYGKNYPLYTTQPEDILMGSFLGNETSSGYNFTSYSNNFRKISMHMLQENTASSVLQNLNSIGMNSEIFRTTLPVGYNYGQVGTSGFSSAEHLHWELIPYFYQQ